MSITTAHRLVFALALAACGDAGGDDLPPDPTDIAFGETAIVVVVNPVINSATDRTVAEPGPTHAGVELTTDDGLSAITDTGGIAVLGPVTPGIREIVVAGPDIDGSIVVDLADGELRELAIAAEGTRIEPMIDIDYRSDRVTEIVPSMTLEEVNDALAVSDTVVFFRSGEYAGDLDFSGSRVTLFGEGVLGGEVVIDGDVVVSGSDSRIRGTLITGELTVPASGVGISFSAVDGLTRSEGSDATLLSNALCGGSEIMGSGSVALGNAGAAPLTACP